MDFDSFDQWFYAPVGEQNRSTPQPRDCETIFCWNFWRILKIRWFLKMLSHNWRKKGSRKYEVEWLEKFQFRWEFHVIKLAQASGQNTPHYFFQFYLFQNHGQPSLIAFDCLLPVKKCSLKWYFNNGIEF